MTLTTQLHSAVQAFFDNQLSPETRRAYKIDLRDFTDWTKGVPINQITVNHVIHYREALLHQYSTATVIRRLAAVRSFFRHLVHCRVIHHDPTAGVKLPRKPNNCTTEAFTDDEVLRMLALTSTEERPIIQLLALLGLRRSELCSLTYGSVGSDKGTTTLSIKGKGGRHRVLPVPSEITIAREVNDQEEPLLQLNGTPLTVDRVRHLVERIAKRAGITKKVSPHSFRATAVSNALDQGSSPVQVQYMCGWSDMSQISRYDKRRQAIHKSAVWDISYAHKGKD